MISTLERKLLRMQPEGTVIVGVANAGAGAFVGPLVSAAVVIDYDNLPSKELVYKILRNGSNNTETATFLNQLPLFCCARTEVDEQNAINNLETAIYHTNYNATNKLLWKLFKQKLVPHAFISHQYYIRDVVKTDIASEYTDNKNTKSYRVISEYSSLKELAVNAYMNKVDKADETLITAIAQNIADRALRVVLAEINKAIPKYKVLDNPGEKQVKYVKKFGNTKYHRIYLPALKKYPMGELMNG